MQVKSAAFRTARPVCSRKIVCQAEKQTPLAQVGAALSATVLAATLSFTAVDAAKADVAGLTPCSESKAFQKRQKNEVKALNKRLKQVNIQLQLARQTKQIYHHQLHLLCTS